MTHYLELLASNQPWNLILFMVIPVILTEFIAVSEFYILLNPQGEKRLRSWNAWAGIGLGKHRTEHSRLWLHARFVAVFLVVAHVAMIVGMLNPTLFGYQAMVI